MNPPATIRVGDILARPKAVGIVTHFGVAITSDLVLQNTPEKGEHIATLQQFSAGKPVTVHRTNADPSIVVARAQAFPAGAAQRTNRGLLRLQDENRKHSGLGGSR